MIILVLHEGFSVHITHYRVVLPSQIPFFSTVQPPWWWCEREEREGSGTAGLSDASIREITPCQSHHTASHPGSHVSNTYLDHFLNSCQRHRLPTMQSLLVLLLLFFSYQTLPHWNSLLCEVLDASLRLIKCELAFVPCDF